MSEVTPVVTEQPPVHPTNPLLERVKIPGASYRLPSGGLFYTDEELDMSSAKDGEVHVYPMNALDEIVIRSPDKILNGMAIAEVFKRCIPEIKQPAKLFAKDVDFLMMALRHVTYGPTIDMSYTHTCEGAKEHQYTINIDEFISSAKSIDPTTINEQFTVTVPNGQIVKLHPIRFRDVIEIMQSSKYDQTQSSSVQRQIFDTLVTVIASVDEVTDKAMIYEWVTTVPSQWFRQISESIDKNSDWGPKTIKTVKCLDCKAEIELELPLNPILFFT